MIEFMIQKYAALTHHMHWFWRKNNVLNSNLIICNKTRFIVGCLFYAISNRLLYRYRFKKLSIGIVGVNNAYFGLVGFAIRLVQHLEHAAFGGAIGFKCAMIIEMFMGDVGENGDINIHAVKPPLREAVTGHFEDTMR